MKSLKMCPHCGRTFLPRKCKPLVPKHEWLPNYYATESVACPGSEQHPRNADSDKRPLWKDE